MGKDLTKVCQLELPLLRDEQVLRLDVSVQDPPPVAVGQAAEELEEEQLHVLRVQTALVPLKVLRQVRVLEKKMRELLWENK
jgi:hypothetical protein